MSINKYIPKEEQQGIIDYYSFKIKELEDKVSHYKNLISKIKLDTLDSQIVINSDEFNSNSDLEEKVLEGFISEALPQNNKVKLPRMNWKYLSLNALNSLDILSTSHEIYDYLVIEKEDLKNYNRTEVVAKISTALSSLNNKNKVSKIKNRIGRGYFWALNSWFHEDNLKQQYKDSLILKYGIDEDAMFGNY